MLLETKAQATTALEIEAVTTPEKLERLYRADPRVHRLWLGPARIRNLGKIHAKED